MSSPTTIDDSELIPEERSRAVVGEATISGVMVVLSYTKPAASPQFAVSTAVVGRTTGRDLTELALFPDVDATRDRLCRLIVANDSTGRLRLDHLTAERFDSWIVLPEGIHFYIEVPHVLGDQVPVTLSWSEVAPLLTAEAKQALAR